jgi:hypothetical protein
MQDQPINLNGLALDAAIGVVVSILGGLFTSCAMKDWQKQLIVLGVSVVLAVARCYLTGDLTTTNIAASIVAVAVSAWTSYQTITAKIARELQVNVGVTGDKPLTVGPVTKD